MADPGEIHDIFIIGGGVNGCGIARDAAGRGLKVVLAEQGDLGSATSSASTKLFHGGLRYLEFFEFGLVRKALKERDMLLKAMPHISRPLRFVLPINPAMRFDRTTPASRFLAVVMPWLGGRRPAWIIRLGLFAYDHLAGKSLLPGTRRIDLAADGAGAALKPGIRTAFEYSDGWVDDARLVALNARSAAEQGASILTRTRVEAARRDGSVWAVDLVDLMTGDERTVHARALVNAGGPWVADILHNLIHVEARAGIRLVRGSHLVTRKLFDHDRAYFLQGTDGRIVFAIPYENDFTLLGTTDVDHPDPETPPVCTDAERDYLLRFVTDYFRTPVTSADIVHSFAGIRPLYDDGASSATEATRDYVLKLDTDGPPLLSVFGGKITTYRKLAEEVLDRLLPALGRNNRHWTGGTPLPGGDFAVGGVASLVAALRAQFPKLEQVQAERLVRAYGTDAAKMLGQTTDGGRDFGAGLTEREVDWMIAHEFAQTADDVVWRRSKLGLRLSAEQIAEIDAYMAARAPGNSRRNP